MTKKLPEDVKILRALNRLLPTKKLWMCPLDNTDCRDCAFNNYGKDRHKIMRDFSNNEAQCGLTNLAYAKDKMLANYAEVRS